MYRLICQKPAHFLFAQMALVSTFFQMFIVVGMYIFGLGLRPRAFQTVLYRINLKKNYTVVFKLFSIFFLIALNKKINCFNAVLIFRAKFPLNLVTFRQKSSQFCIPKIDTSQSTSFLVYTNKKMT